MKGNSRFLPSDEELMAVAPKFWADAEKAIKELNSPTADDELAFLKEKFFGGAPKRNLSKIDPSPKADGKVDYPELAGTNTALVQALDDAEAEFNATITCTPK